MNWMDWIVIVRRSGEVKLNWIGACPYRLVPVKIAGVMLSYIFAHHNDSVVNIYHHNITGSNDPYGVKVIKWRIAPYYQMYLKE